VESSVREAVTMFKQLGAEIIEIDIPDIAESARLQGVITSAEAYAYHSAYLKDRYADYGQNVRVRLEAGQYIPAWVYVEAQRLRQKIQQNWAAVYCSL
jgi:aspartyl-tRNA(Asn)/glutamyl-tRNA(Gln) amidotransferase subunit A